MLLLSLRLLRMTSLRGTASATVSAATISSARFRSSVSLPTTKMANLLLQYRIPLAPYVAEAGWAGLWAPSCVATGHFLDELLVGFEGCGRNHKPPAPEDGRELLQDRLLASLHVVEISAEERQGRALASIAACGQKSSRGLPSFSQLCLLLELCIFEGPADLRAHFYTFSSDTVAADANLTNLLQPKHLSMRQV